MTKRKPSDGSILKIQGLQNQLLAWVQQRYRIDTAVHKALLENHFSLVPTGNRLTTAVGCVHGRVGPLTLDLQFYDGLTVIEGLNRAGKSILLDAISAGAIYRKMRAHGGDLINKFVPQDPADGNLRVEIMLGSTWAKFFHSASSSTIALDGRVEDGFTKFNAWVVENCESFSYFTTFVLCAQGAADHWYREGPAQRARILRSALRLEALDDAAKRASKLANTAKTRLENLKITKEKLPQIQEWKRKAENVFNLRALRDYHDANTAARQAIDKAKDAIETRRQVLEMSNLPTPEQIDRAKTRLMAYATHDATIADLQQQLAAAINQRAQLKDQLQADDKLESPPCGALDAPQSAFEVCPYVRQLRTRNAQRDANQRALDAKEAQIRELDATLWMARADCASEEARERTRAIARTNLTSALQLQTEIDEAQRKISQVEALMAENNESAQHLVDVIGPVANVYEALAEAEHAQRELARAPKIPDDLDDQITTLEAQIQALDHLREACSPKGLSQLAIDRLVPAIAEITADLIDAFDGSITVDLVTQTDKGKETVDLLIRDRVTGRAQPIEWMAESMRTVVDIAFRIAVLVAVAEQTGEEYGVLFLDEVTAPFDAGNVVHFCEMLKKALTQYGFRQIFLVSHHHQAIEAADHVIHVGHGTATTSPH